MQPLHLVVTEEIALEGLDGITLDAFWFRLSERLKFPLPLNKNFQNEIWKLVISHKCFEYYEIAKDRATPKTLDRVKFFFNDEITNEVFNEYMNDCYFIYSHDPVDHPEVRGSCKEFATRKKLDVDKLKAKSLDEIAKTYNQRLVIVANQSMRNSVLIPKNAGQECDINNHAYCILERIGRSRYFGELTSGPFSINCFIKDSKLLHYFRNTLLQYQLVVRQQIQKKFRNCKIAGQLFHLPRYHVLIEETSTLQAEKLFTYLKEKPTRMSEISELRELLKLNQKGFLALVKSRPTIFEYNMKTAYRECYPDAKPGQYFYKKKGRDKEEKQITTVQLKVPDIDIFKLLKGDEDLPAKEKGFLDITHQQINKGLAYQIYDHIETSGTNGVSQLELGAHHGLSKLNSRSVIRNVQRTRGITFYMKDEGRQRVSKFVTTEASKKNSAGVVSEMEKLLKKADEAAALCSNITPKRESISNNSSTKVSIPLTPLTLKLLKTEPESQPAITFVNTNVLNDADDDEDVSMESPANGASQEFIDPSEGTSFVDNIEKITASLRFLNHVPDIKPESSGIAESVAQNRISHKVLTRMNATLDFIKKNTVVETLTLVHAIREFEADCREELCRKSMLSLCNKLATDNLIKVIEVELKSETKTVKLLYFGVQHVTFEMQCWKSIIEEMKIHHFVLHRSEPKLPLGSLTPSDSKTSTVSDEFAAQSKRCENFPKFMKMKLFHEFLFFLIYAYPAEHKMIPMRDAIQIWKKENPNLQEHEEATDVMNCYTTDISWRMFVSPIKTKLDGYEGWGFLRDIIHRIPLVLAVKLIRNSATNPKIQAFLQHPIKCNYLLHFLPAEIREHFLRGRKFVFVVQEICRRLAWCGLLQFGKSRGKEIDQSYIRLNRKASLLDTTSSEHGYMEVSEKEYPEENFTFNAEQDLVDYWNRMHEIGLNTKINKKALADGKYLEVDSNGSPALRLALELQSPGAAELNDLGKIPGDNKGAAGLDKTMMAHLPQNWSRQIKSKVKGERVRPVKLASKLKPRIKKDKSTVVKEAANRIKNKIINSVHSKFSSKSAQMVKKAALNHLMRKKAVIAEDVVDKQALKMMKTLRVTWNEIEDKTLLLIKVAMNVAFSGEASSFHYINAPIIRNILHWRTEKALNKTSKSCARRMLYLIKSKPSFKQQIVLYSEELRVNQEFMAKYRNLVNRLKEIYTVEELYDAVKIHFVEMVHRIHQIFYKQLLDNKDAGCSYQLPNDYNELTKAFTILNPKDSLIDKKYHEPRNLNEVVINVLMSLIHSAICCTHEKNNYSTILFEVYKKYPEHKLTAAVSQLKRATVISANKKDKTKDNKILPCTFAPFQLSSRYAIQMMAVHVPIELYDEYFKAAEVLSNTKEAFHLNDLNCGWIFMLAEMMNCGKICLTFNIAEKLIMIDPALRKKSSFEKFSENYLQNQQAERLKKKKTVKFPPGEIVHDTFLFGDDPIEIFLKMDRIYLHAFCIVKALVNGDDLYVKRWNLNEDGECSLKTCILKDEEKFAENARAIAEEGSKLLKEVLEGAGPSKENSNLITRQNFVTFFDNFLRKHFSSFEANDRKDFSKKAKAKKIPAKIVLECILMLSTEPGQEEDYWITEYNKISGKSDDEALDDEDIDTAPDQIKHSSMLNQLKELNLANKTSDSFVVNLSKISVELKESDGAKVTFDGFEFDSNLLPFKEERRASIIEKILTEAKYKPEDLTERDLVETLKAVGITNTIEIMNISEVCDFVQSKGEMGSIASELVAMFPNKARLQKNIETLIAVKFVLRSGVTEARFIHKDFVTFWLVDTFYVTREDDSATKANNKRRLDDNTSDQPPAKRRVTSISEIKIEAPDEIEEEYYETSEPVKILVPPPMIRYPIRVQASPWIRVNGTLNRRVLDKWLGTVLNHLTLHPGMMVSDLNRKFNILTPFHIRTLCELLQNIGCVELMIATSPDVDLFSNEFEAINETATFFCPSNCVYIEVKDNAMQSLTFFIGRKKYKAPFV